MVKNFISYTLECRFAILFARHFYIPGNVEEGN